MSATVSYTFNKPSGILDLSNTVTINKASASVLTPTTNPSLSGDKLIYNTNILNSNYSTITLPGRTYPTSTSLASFNERIFMDITINSTTGWSSNPLPIFNIQIDQTSPFNDYNQQMMLFIDQTGVYGGYTNNYQNYISFPYLNNTSSRSGTDSTGYSIKNAQYYTWPRSYTINAGDRIFIMANLSRPSGTLEIYRYTSTGVEMLIGGRGDLLIFPTNVFGSDYYLSSINLLQPTYTNYSSTAGFNGATINNIYYNIKPTITGLQIVNALVKTAPILNNNLTLYYPPSLSTNNGRVFDLSNIFYTLSGSVRPDPTASNKNYGIVLFNFPNPSQWTFTKSSGTSSISSLTANQGIVCDISNITNSVKTLTYNGSVSGDISFNFLICDSGTIPTSNSIVDITTRGGQSAFSENVGTIIIPPPIPLSEEYSLFKQLYELSGYDIQFSPNGQFAALLNNTFIDIYSSSGDIWTKTQRIDISGGTTGNLYIRSTTSSTINSYIQSNISAACKFSNSANLFIIIRSDFIYVYMLNEYNLYNYVNQFNMIFNENNNTPITTALITDATITNTGSLYTLCYRTKTYNSSNAAFIVNIRNCTDISSLLIREALHINSSRNNQKVDQYPYSYFFNKINLSPDNRFIYIQCYQPFSNSKSLYSYIRYYEFIYDTIGVYLKEYQSPYSMSNIGETSGILAYVNNNSNNRIFAINSLTATEYLKSGTSIYQNRSGVETNSSIYYTAKYQNTDFKNVYTTAIDNNNPYKNRGLGRSTVLSADGKVLITSYINPVESSTINTTGSYPISILYNSKSVIDPTFPITTNDVSNNLVFVHNKSITKNDGNIFGMDITSTADCKYIGVASSAIPAALTSSTTLAGKCYLYKLEIHYAPRYTNTTYNEVAFTINDNNNTYVPGSAVHVGTLLNTLGAVQDNGNTIGIAASFPTIANFKFQYTNQLVINTPFWNDISGTTPTNRIHLDADTYIRCVPINISGGQTGFDSSFNIQIWDTDNGILPGTIAAIPTFKSTGHYSQNSSNIRFRVNAPIHIFPNQIVRSSQISTFKLFKNTSIQENYPNTLQTIITQGNIQWRDTVFNKDLTRIKVRCKNILNDKGTFLYSNGGDYTPIQIGTTMDLSNIIQFIPFKQFAKSNSYIDFAFLQNSTIETPNTFRVLPVIKAPPTLLTTSIPFDLSYKITNKTIDISWTSLSDSATYTIGVNNVESSEQSDTTYTINGNYGGSYNIWIKSGDLYTPEKTAIIPNTITLSTPVITNFINCTVPLQITNISTNFTTALLNITLDNSSVYQRTIYEHEIGALNSIINISGIVLDFNKTYSCSLTTQYSDISTIQTVAINALAPLPTNITATNITGKSMTLNWQFNNTNDISGFVIIFGNKPYIIDSIVRTCNITGLEPYLEYTYTFVVLYKNNTIIYSPEYKQLTPAQYESSIITNMNERYANFTSDRTRQIIVTRRPLIVNKITLEIKTTYKYTISQFTSWWQIYLINENNNSNSIFGNIYNNQNNIVFEFVNSTSNTPPYIYRCSIVSPNSNGGYAAFNFLNNPSNINTYKYYSIYLDLGVYGSNPTFSYSYTLE